MTRTIRVLIVEDCSDDADLMLLHLRPEGYTLTWQRVETAEEMQAALAAKSWDIILSDYTLPQFSALAALELAQEVVPDVPFVVVSGTVGEEVAVATMRAGASDYVLKRNLARLGPAVTRELREAENRRKQRSAFRLAAIVQSSNDAILAKTLEGIITEWNPGAERLYGYLASEVLGKHVSLLVPPDRGEELAEIMERLRRGEGISLLETVRLRKDGTPLHVSLTLSPIRNTAGELIGASTVARDVTEHRKAQRQAAEHLALLETLLGNAPVGFAFLDRECRYVRANEAFAALTGVPVGKMLGHTVAEMAPQVWPQVEPIYRRLLAGEGPSLNREIRSERRTAPGEFKYSLASHYPVRIGGEIAGIGVIVNDITERKKAETALRLRDRAMQAVTQGIFICDAARLDHPIIYVSPAFESITGYRAGDVLGRDCRLLHGPDTNPATLAQINESLAAGRPWSGEILNYRKDGIRFWNALSLAPVRDEAGRLTHFVGVQTDVTEKKRLEEQFQQAQKMEAVGRLAGGVAHDFNNLLTIINGYGQILLDRLPQGDPGRELLSQITAAGDRAASLTRQLLAFSRQQVIEPQVLDLREVVQETDKLLRRVIGEDVEFTMTVAPVPLMVKADAGQVGQILLNLAVNARDAMPTGGKLTVEVRNVDLDEADTRSHAGVKPGRYVLLAVRDTGCGMTREVQARIFEPFFTTKGPGKGTGLGLATVYGIVQQAGGHIDVSSEPGRGTTFQLYFPRIETDRPSRKSHPGLVVMPRGRETILLVEDEDAVRTLGRHILQSCGYTILEASHGEEAVRLAQTHRGRIDLLMTDVVMPRLGGREVVERVTEQHPETRVLFLSGYTDDAVVRHGVLDREVAFLQKPFSPISLARKVRDILDQQQDQD